MAQKLHARHPGRTACLALIAGLAGAHHVLPGMFASEAARHDMVYGKLSGLPAAVLTGEIVPHKDFAATELSLRAGSFNHVNQADYRGERDCQGGAAEHSGVFLYHLSFAPPYQHDGSPRPADIQRFVILIENKDRGINHNKLRVSLILAGK